MRLIIFLYTLLMVSTTFADESKVRAYVDNLVNQVTTVLASDRPMGEKKSQAANLIKQNLDFDYMSNYAIGNLKNTLTPQQLNDYRSLYNDYMTGIYSSLVKSYNGEKTVVQGIVNEGSGNYRVSTTVEKAGNSGHGIRVEYEVHTTNGGLKIADIKTEGVSQIDTQRAEFRSVVDGSGFDTLKANLQASR